MQSHRCRSEATKHKEVRKKKGTSRKGSSSFQIHLFFTFDCRIQGRSWQLASTQASATRTRNESLSKYFVSLLFQSTLTPFVADTSGGEECFDRRPSQNGNRNCCWILNLVTHIPQVAGKGHVSSAKFFQELQEEQELSKASSSKQPTNGKKRRH